MPNVMLQHVLPVWSLSLAPVRLAQPLRWDAGLSWRRDNDVGEQG